MHVTLQRYARPPRGFVRFFTVGLLSGLMVFALVVEQLGGIR